MRLLTWDQNGQIVLTDEFIDNVPPYAILSHTWGSEEVLFGDIKIGAGRNKAAFAKITFCGEQAKKDGFEYFWVDTCCIDKSNSVELSEAIISMFRWYKEAGRCYVHLIDLCQGDIESVAVADGVPQLKVDDLRHCHWFSRGWTLQELLAPKDVQFFSKDGVYLGNKQTLVRHIHDITSIPIEALNDPELVDRFSIDERIRWANMRKTTRVEDSAYCLFGIFNVRMSIRYGERTDALDRLRKKINDRWGTNVATQLNPATESGFALPSRTSTLREHAVPDDNHLNPGKRTYSLMTEDSMTPKRTRTDRSDDFSTRTPGQNTSSDSHHAEEATCHDQILTQDAQRIATRVDANHPLVKSLLFDRIGFRARNVRRPMSSTCEWLFQHSHFQAFYKSDCTNQNDNFLWIKGKPGCGKSTLMKAALDWIGRQNSKVRFRKTVVPYFFHARGLTDLEKSSLGLYRTLVHHMVSTQLTSFNLFINQFVHKNPEIEDDVWTAEELQGFLEDALESADKYELYLLIDALDEAQYDEDVRQMISFLERLSERVVLSNSTCKIRVCLSSRHYPHIEISAGLSLTVELQRDHKKDIEKYIMKALTYKDLNAGHLRATLLDRSASIFLWVVLVIQILNQLHARAASLEDMETRLQEIPLDLYALFTEILTKNEHGIENSVVLFQWMVFGMRAMSPDELYIAMEFSKSPADENWTPPADIAVPSSDRLAKLVLDRSRGLAEIVEGESSELSTVQFIHETVREFLLDNKGMSSVISTLTMNSIGLSHEILRVACFRRITSIPVPAQWTCYIRQGHGSNAQQKQFKSHLRQSLPFLEYSAMHVLDHADKAQEHNINQQSFLKRIHCGTSWAESYRQWWNIMERYGSQKIDHDVSLAHHLVRRAKCALLKEILKLKPDSVNASCKQYHSVLYTAVYYGNIDALQVLIHNGADLRDEYALSLCQAARKGFRAILQMLLDHGANLDSYTSFRSAALRYTAATGSENGVRLLLDFDIVPTNDDIKVICRILQVMDYNILRLLLERCVGMELDYADMLRTAIANGKSRILTILLDHGADVNMPLADAACGTALILAARLESVKMTQLMLERGADIDAQSDDGTTALQMAASLNSIKIVRMLLENGADVNTQGSQSCTALIAAAARGSQDIVQALLDHNADVNLMTDGRTALHDAVEGKHEGVVRMLLNRGAGVNMLRKNQFAPLDLAVSQSSHKIARTLLEAGADHRLRDINCLNRSAASGNMEIFELVLDPVIDMVIPGKSLEQALQCAADKAHHSIVILLLDYGVDISIVRLGLLATAKHEQVLKTLLSRGADVNAYDPMYGNVLHGAVLQREDRIVQLLLDRGVNIHVSHGVWGTALQIACKLKHADIVRMLLKHGANVHAASEGMRSALSAAQIDNLPHRSVDRLEIIQLLKDHGAVENPDQPR